MAINFDTKKGAEKLTGFLQKTTEVGKNAAESVQKSAATLSEKVRDASYQDRLKKYNPLFPEEYTDTAFILPHLIVIVDEASMIDVNLFFSFRSLFTNKRANFLMFRHAKRRARKL